MNNLYGWSMSQNFPLYGFKWVKETPQFNRNFWECYSEDPDVGYFIEAHFQYSEKLYELHNNLTVLSGNNKNSLRWNLQQTCKIKINMMSI